MLEEGKGQGLYQVNHRGLRDNVGKSPKRGAYP